MSKPSPSTRGGHPRPQLDGVDVASAADSYDNDDEDIVWLLCSCRRLSISLRTWSRPAYALYTSPKRTNFEAGSVMLIFAPRDVPFVWRSRLLVCSSVGRVAWIVGCGRRQSDTHFTVPERVEGWVGVKAEVVAFSEWSGVLEFGNE